MARIYVAGGMSGYDNLNFPAFDASSNFLRALGWDVVNPADLDRAMGIDPSKYDALTDVPESLRQDALARDFLELCTCDAIALLPGWRQSRGARAERFVAEQIGLVVHHLVPLVIPGAYSLIRERKPVIVGLSGYAQAGKDTAGEIMVKAGIGFARLAFADPLKRIAEACDPLFNVFTGTGTKIVDGEMRHVNMTGHRRLSQLLKDGGWEWAKQFAPEARNLLQDLGVAVRDHVDPDAWVNATMRKIEPGFKYVITDCRFPNEAAAIRSAGGHVVRVTRPGTGPVNGHVSETALDDFDFDATLVNDGDIARLTARVHLFLRSLP